MKREMSTSDTQAVLNEYRQIIMEMNRLISNGGNQESGEYKALVRRQEEKINLLRSKGYNTRKLLPERGRLRKYKGPIGLAVKARTDLIIDEKDLKDVKSTSLPPPKLGKRFRFNPVRRDWIEEDDRIDIESELPLSPPSLDYKYKKGIISKLPTAAEGQITGIFVVWNNKVLIQLRSTGEFLKGKITIPAGSVEEGENWFDAALRELHEQTQIKLPDDVQIDSLSTYLNPPKKYPGMKKRVYFLIQLKSKPLLFGPDSKHKSNINLTFDFYRQGIPGEVAGNNTGHYWADIPKLIAWLGSEANKDYKFSIDYTNLNLLKTKLGLDEDILPRFYDGRSPSPGKPGAPSSGPGTPTPTPSTPTPSTPTSPLSILSSSSTVGTTDETSEHKACVESCAKPCPKACPSATPVSTTVKSTEEDKTKKRQEIKLAGRIYYIDYDEDAQNRRKAIFNEGAPLSLTKDEEELLNSVGIKGDTRKNLAPYLYDFFESLPNCQTSTKMLTSRECEVAYYVMWSVLMKARQDLQKNIDDSHKNGHMPDSEMFQTEARLAAMSRVGTESTISGSTAAIGQMTAEAHKEHEEMLCIIRRIELKLNECCKGISSDDEIGKKMCEEGSTSETDKKPSESDDAKSGNAKSGNANSGDAKSGNAKSGDAKTENTSKATKSSDNTEEPPKSNKSNNKENAKGSEASEEEKSTKGGMSEIARLFKRQTR